MKKIKAVRLVLIILIFLTLLITFLNYYKPPKIKIVDNNSSHVNANMVIEKGEHDIFSTEGIFAHLSYEKAVQKDKTLDVKGVKIDFLKNKGELKAKNALLEDSTVFFNDVVEGFFPEKQMKISVEPPSLLKNSFLKGNGRIVLMFPDFKLTGKRFFFDIDKNFLGMSEMSYLKSKKIKIHSRFCISNLKEKEYFIFYKDALFYNHVENLNVNADLIKSLRGNPRIFFRGRVKVKTQSSTFTFVSGFYENLKNGSYIKVNGPFKIEGKKFSANGSDCIIENKKAFSNYIKLLFDSYIFSGVNNRFNMVNRQVVGDNPFLYNKKNSERLKGRSYTYFKDKLSIFDTVYSDRDSFLTCSKCVIDKKNQIIFPDRVYGIFKNYRFTGSSAIVKKGYKVVKDGEIISIEEENNLIRGKKIEFSAKDGIVLKDNVFARRTMRRGETGEILCNYMNIPGNNDRVYLSNNVSILSGSLKAYPKNAIVLKTYAILFDCNFEIEGKYTGYSKVIIVNYNGRYSYLFFANIKDSNGNSLKGDKLTLDNLTDRIFIEKARENSGVEVKIKI